MEEVKIKLFLSVSTLLFSGVFSSDVENPDSHHEKCKKFETEMGRPNIYYDENNDLVMLVKVYRGGSNRVVDSGVDSVGIQLKKDNTINVNEELVSFLSQVLNIKGSFFTVLPGDKHFDKFVKIQGSVITAYELIDKLVAALEVTAKDEPSALCVTGKPELGKQEKLHGLQEADLTKEFDWRNKKLD